MALEDSEEIMERMGVPTMHIDLDSKYVPAVKGWKVGDTQTFTITGRVKSMSEGYGGKGINACIEVGRDEKDSEDDD